MHFAEILFTLSRPVSRYGKIILSGPGFQLRAGEPVAITGSSGAGKSSLLHAIARQFNAEPLPGHLSGKRRPAIVTGQQPHFKNLSNTTELYYQQRYNASESEDAVTVREYLASVPAGEFFFWTFEKVVALFSLGPLADKQVIQLSNGEVRRLLLAASLLRNPALLLLDNPFIGLDVRMRAQMNEIFQMIISSGITLVLVAPAEQIPSIFKRVLWLEDGELREASRLPQQRGAAAIDEQALLEIAGTSEFPAASIIEMNEVSLTYGDKQVLHKINWVLKQGERWSLSGANGAGKSTLLSLIYGDNPQAYANDIRLFGRRRGSGESIWDIKKNIGYVSPEMARFFPGGSSCAHIIESGFYDTQGLFRRSDPARYAICLKWMKMMQLDAAPSELFRNTSAGTQRMCLLARAMVKLPPLLILDEPLQGLDEEQARRFHAVLKAIVTTGNRSLIYVTHHAEELEGIADRGLVLEKGRIV